MRFWPLPLLAAATLAAAACRSPVSGTGVACRDPSWHPAISLDSSVAFCLPADYRQAARSNLWTRPVDSLPPRFVSDTWVGVFQVADAEMRDEDLPFPPSLLRDTTYLCVDCLTVSHYAVHWDSVGARLVRVETGRVSGGFSGERDAPALRAVWRAPDGNWLIMEGRATDMQGLLELRHILRTVQVIRSLEVSKRDDA